jgi:hypothetical protein
MPTKTLEKGRQIFPYAGKRRRKREKRKGKISFFWTFPTLTAYAA